MEAATPRAEGQDVVAVDDNGERWRLQCHGEPVNVGDRVGFMPIAGAGTPRPGQGQMTRLIEGTRDEWVCRLVRQRGRITLKPFGGLDMPEWVLSETDAGEARDGDRVLVVPLNDPRRTKKASRSKSRSRAGRRSQSMRVRVKRVLGPAGGGEADFRALVWKHRLATSFSRRARLEAEECAEALDAGEAQKRIDLRHLPFVTIDPFGARDHDDAVFAEERSMTSPVQAVAPPDAPEADGPARSRSGSWRRRLWVAIADVAHFVPEGSYLDAEARRRGNSFYFPDRALPMLPESLSTDACSLKADRDRLVMVVELRIAADGRVGDALFHEAVIRSRADLTYEDASAFMDREAGTPAEGAAHAATGDHGSASGREAVPEWGASLRCLAQIAADFGRLRAEQGAIELDLPEVQIRTDDQGRAVDAVLRERIPAHAWIEEAMLAANRAVATALDRAERATLHRVHPPPGAQKVAALTSLLDRFGVRVTEDLSDPMALSSVLAASETHPARDRIHEAVLRSMSQARYDPESKGHFALRFDHYLHFTSPIRRYADLVVHRALKRLIHSTDPEKNPGSNTITLDRLAIWLSARERVATRAERDAEALACCAILAGREGEQFRARVAAVTQFGLFVRLDSPVANGLVPMRSLGHEWLFDPEAESLEPARAGKPIEIGSRVDVLLVETDPDLGRLRFELVRRRPRRSGTAKGRHARVSSSS